jgi:hypothetical protein
MKKCSKCQAFLGLEMFYRHPATADGLLGKCKQCCCRESAENRRKNLDYYRAYDKDRAGNESRKKTVAAKTKRHRKSEPQKYKARTAVFSALRSGLLTRMPCEKCGSNHADAHHDDYGKPLDVRWLCRQHHLAEHGNYLALVAGGN